jgi:DNA modification methylase
LRETKVNKSAQGRTKVDTGTAEVAPKAVPLSRLHPAEWNPRTIKEERFQNLCDSIRADPDFLWRRPILAQADGTIYAGNMRFRAAEHLGFETVPAIVEDVPDQLARERALRDNAQWGDWEADELAALLAGLQSQGSDLELLGLEPRELQRLLDSLERSTALGDPEDIPPVPEEPVSKPGDLWLLGPHRVLCGDAREPEAVARVMDGELATCVWTDPPYGVEYVGGTKRALTIQNDHPETLESLLRESFAAINEVLAPGAAIYVAHPAGSLSVTFGSCFLAQGWRLHQTLVWVKDRLVPGHSDYHYRHEPILFGYKAADGRRGRGSRGWYGGNDAASVFEVPRPSVSADHPTSKPVHLVEAMVKNSSRSGDVVLDPFLGSGSTLIAAERLGRRCFGIDIDPRYVDVAVRRWERYTGGKARRE